MTASLLTPSWRKSRNRRGISNPKDFRNEIVNFVLRARANNSGRNPNWTSYEKLRTVIEKKNVLQYRGAVAGYFV
ncbi:hypothetical protein HTY54_22540 [Escherichia coli]|nr:hypothetical protein [Escherichia coli]